jgi:hypothetical protein
LTLMDPIYPWLDPLEVRRLADRLLRPSHEPAAAIADAGFGEGFVGFASEMPVLPPAPAPPPPPAPHPAAKSPAPVAAVVSALAKTPLLDRLPPFREWMQKNFSATGMFLLDSEGAVIFDASNHGRLHFLARSLALANRRPGQAAGNVQIKIGAGATLEVIPVETAQGWLMLGAVVPVPLDRPAVAAVMDALTQVAAGPVGR